MKLYMTENEDKAERYRDEPGRRSSDAGRKD